MEKLVLKSEYITLGQLLKAMGYVYDGAEAKERIRAGEAAVNGETEIRRGRKLYDGDIVEFENNKVMVVK